ncbi:condensation domain-containing protein, partial [Vibrio lentus]|uniref:condensation domain-containing protein n=1 Tax=Vibrio lentus TaxID=136468 RepID=UPI002468A704
MKYIVNSTCLIKDALVSNVIFDDWEKVISSKVKGSKNILSSIKLNKLNDVHLINYSSLTSFIGNVGQTAYAAANYFLDDLSLYLKNQGVCTTTINWGPISDIGDLSTNEVAKKAVVDLGMKLITSQEIKDTLSYCLYDKPNKITLAPVEWDKFISVNNLGNNTLFLSMSVEKTNGSNTNNIQNSFSQDWSLLNVKDRLDNVKNIITDLVQNRLKSNNINVTQNLKDYGLDSLSGILLKNQIEKLFEIKLPVQFCFDFSSIESMVLEVKKLTKVQSDISNNSDKVDISFQQKRWLNLLNKGYGKLVVPIVFNTELNDELFYKALSLVIHKHDILRCVFSYNEAKLLSISDVIKQMKRTFYDLKLLNDREKRLSEIYNSVIDGYNDISVMTPYQLHLVDYKKDQFVILLALQHLVFDGTSVSIFINDLRNAYSDLMLGTSKFNYSTTQYSSYIDEQNLYSSSESYLSAKNFFSGLFLGCNKNMYHDRETMTNTYTRSSCSTALEIDGELRSDIIKLSKRMKASVFSIFAYAYSKIILDMNNNQSSVLGSVFNCRPSKYENVIGPFVTSYPLKVVPYNSDEDAIKYINELVLTINDNPMYMPLNMVEDVSLFNDLPSDTYFSDYYIMMNNYMHEELDTDLDVEVLECLEPIENKEFKSLECNKLEEVASLFLVIDEYKERYRLNLWYHIDTFSKEK